MRDHPALGTVDVAALADVQQMVRELLPCRIGRLHDDGTADPPSPALPTEQPQDVLPEYLEQIAAAQRSPALLT